ncbi:hypothetical protein G1C97_0479 [Bifidobacterium sp. DSM 109959]|uniref:Uncharacterized protein n=1 Tax=Bifidobacterium olomucense TaxID=2675324 RepID=A0A7Y0HUU1_9BIFI|nr:hypothetical protein [Bifidobacterium sp. DSM 109959]
MHRCNAERRTYTTKPLQTTQRSEGLRHAREPTTRTRPHQGGTLRGRGAGGPEPRGSGNRRGRPKESNAGGPGLPREQPGPPALVPCASPPVGRGQCPMRDIRLARVTSSWFGDPDHGSAARRRRPARHVQYRPTAPPRWGTEDSRSKPRKRPEDVAVPMREPRQSGGRRSREGPRTIRRHEAPPVSRRPEGPHHAKDRTDENQAPIGSNEAARAGMIIPVAEQDHGTDGTRPNGQGAKNERGMNEEE